jgi:adenine-specific DNA methylase
MKQEIQRLAFGRLSYNEKLDYVDRPEQVDGPSEEAWSEINEHLDTDASSLDELIQELGKRWFGHIPRVGDAFCGGGSVPFEAARLGCESYGADLSPVATLLTWASLNIVGGSEEVAECVREAQEEVYDAVGKKITQWGIEHNEKGWRADAYLYCLETECPECGTDVPLAPSWVIGKRTNTIARLELDEATDRFDIRIEEGVSKADVDTADDAGTVQNDRLQCPACGRATPMKAIRGDHQGENGTTNSLRKWQNEDVTPRPDDTFQERLYCVRWVETYTGEDDNEHTRRHYRTVTDADRKREKKVLRLLEDRFEEWQAKGYIPSRQIEPGKKTGELIRTRGWTHWHHLFSPRQLLVNGSFLAKADELLEQKAEIVGCLLGTAKCADWNGKLSFWDSSAANEKVSHAFFNQALNPQNSYASRAWSALDTSWKLSFPSAEIHGEPYSEPGDTRSIDRDCDFWITDPPYADAINYHELSEFFLSWYEKPLRRLFPEWYTDSKRALAITGEEEEFRRDMVASYRNLVERMPDDGAQIVMFTHQDSSVWADLARILAASGLRVTSAWTIATETDSALKKGNYVQGTVLLILRKRLDERTAYSDEISVQVEDEVKSQLDTMQALDEDEDDPSFGDTDYQLAAYAAALRVLTEYSEIDGESWEEALNRPFGDGAPPSRTSSIESVIDDAVEVACNHLIPNGFDDFLWKTLEPKERLYLKGLELESNNEYRTGAYQELARGFGVREYKDLYASSKANRSRFKTPSEFGSQNLGNEDSFSDSLVRHALFAVYEAEREDEARKGLHWLKTEVDAYWQNRKHLIEILRYFERMETGSEEWDEDAAYARLVAGAVENDHA